MRFELGTLGPAEFVVLEAAPTRERASQQRIGTPFRATRRWVSRASSLTSIARPRLIRCFAAATETSWTSATWAAVSPWTSCRTMAER